MWSWKGVCEVGKPFSARCERKRESVRFNSLQLRAEATSPPPPAPLHFFLPTGCESFAGRLVGFRQKMREISLGGKNCFPGDGNKTECGIGDRVGFCRKCVVVLVQLSGLFFPPLDHRRIHPVHLRGKDRHSQGVTSIWKLRWAKWRCPYIWPPCNLRADRGKVAAAAALSSSSDRRNQHPRSVSGVGFAHHTRCSALK